MPKYKGVAKTRVVGDGDGRINRCKGSRSERKRTSSVMGPATKLRQPIQLLRVSCISRPLIHSRQPESTMALSDSGPAKRSAVRSETLAMLSREIGYHPSWCRSDQGSRWPRVERM